VQHLQPTRNTNVLVQTDQCRKTNTRDWII